MFSSARSLPSDAVPTIPLGAQYPVCCAETTESGLANEANGRLGATSGSRVAALLLDQSVKTTLPKTSPATIFSKP